MARMDQKVLPLPNMKKPCKNCPFRKDSLRGWLGEGRMINILAADSFVCHKRQNMQCAGHMLINGQENGFVRLAYRLGLELELSGQELIFDSKQDCISHHRFK